MNTEATRIDIINEIAKQTDAQTYLEIGVRNPGDCFDQVQIPQRWGVDPRHVQNSAPIELHASKNQPVRGFFRGTSEDFGQAMAKAARQRKRLRPGGKGTVPVPKTFDVIFVDGDHRDHVAYEDFCMAARILKPGGFMVAHDVLPNKAEEALPEKPSNGKAWCGEVWKSWRDRVMWHRDERPCFAHRVFDTDHGVGVAVLLPEGSQNALEAKAVIMRDVSSITAWYSLRDQGFAVSDEFLSAVIQEMRTIVAG